MCHVLNHLNGQNSIEMMEKKSKFDAFFQIKWLQERKEIKHANFAKKRQRLLKG